MKRQRILYLNAISRSIRAPIVGFAIHEPVESESPQIQVGAEAPYESVHHAVMDGWRVVCFPGQRTEGDPESVGVFGYEFILDQMAELDD